MCYCINERINKLQNEWHSQRSFSCKNPIRVTSIELSTSSLGAVSREENQTEHAKEAE
jgi:hypothetical protein